MARDQSNPRPQGLRFSKQPDFLRDADKRAWHDVWETIYPGIGDHSYTLEQLVIAFRDGTIDPKQMRMGSLLSRLRRMAEEMQTITSRFVDRLEQKYGKAQSAKELFAQHPEEQCEELNLIIPAWNELRFKVGEALGIWRNGNVDRGSLTNEQHWAQFALRR